ncbi:MAG: hypothetical protein AAGJ35_11770 [Myxococcota bacterium]
MYTPHFPLPQNAPQAATLGVDLVTQIRAQHQKDPVSDEILEITTELDTQNQQLNNDKDSTYQERFEANMRCDRAESGLHSTLEGKIQTLSAILNPTDIQKQELEDAEQLMQTSFPDGIGYLKTSWREQYGTTKLMLQRLEPPQFQEIIARLGLTQQYNVVIELHRQFGLIAGYTKATEKDQPSEFSTWKEVLQSFLMIVMTKTRKDPELQEQLLAPYTRFVQERKRKKRPTAKPQDSAQETPSSTKEPS